MSENIKRGNDMPVIVDDYENTVGRYNIRKGDLLISINSVGVDDVNVFKIMVKNLPHDGVSICDLERRGAPIKINVKNNDLNYIYMRENRLPTIHDYGIGYDKNTDKPVGEGVNGLQKNSSNYETAKFTSTILQGVGWFVVAGGVMSVPLLLLTNENNPAGFLASLGVVFGGLLLVMGAQVTRATVDNADNTREILEIMKKK